MKSTEKEAQNLKNKTGGGAFDPQEKNIYFIALSPCQQQSYSDKELQMIKTAGGTFDSKEENIYFIASNVDRLVPGAPVHDYLLVAVNELKTQKELMHLDGWISSGKKVFIDSGIFNLTNDHKRKHGITMDQALSLPPDQIDGFDNLFERYVEIVTKYQDHCWGYIELDQGGRKNKIKTRERLEALGLKPIPVYHPLNDGWDYFDYLAERYDRICFGNVVQADRFTRKRLITTAWERHRKYPDLWIHLLGFTPNEWLNALPINSGDSSSWLSAVRWSGYKERSMGASFGDMPKNFQYELGSDRDSETGSRMGTRMAAYGSFINQKNWRNHIRTLENMGFEIYPALKDQE